MALSAAASADTLLEEFDRDCFGTFLGLLARANAAWQANDIIGYYAHLSPENLRSAIGGSAQTASNKWAHVLSSTTTWWISEYRTGAAAIVDDITRSATYLRSDFVGRAGLTGGDWADGAAFAGKFVGGEIGKNFADDLVGVGSFGEAIVGLAGQVVGSVAGKLAGFAVGGLYNVTVRDQEMAAEFATHLQRLIDHFNASRTSIKRGFHGDAQRWIEAPRSQSAPQSSGTQPRIDEGNGCLAAIIGVVTVVVGGFVVAMHGSGDVPMTAPADLPSQEDVEQGAAPTTTQEPAQPAPQTRQEQTEEVSTLEAICGRDNVEGASCTRCPQWTVDRGVSGLNGAESDLVVRRTFATELDGFPVHLVEVVDEACIPPQFNSGALLAVLHSGGAAAFLGARFGVLLRNCVSGADGGGWVVCDGAECGPGTCAGGLAELRLEGTALRTATLLSWETTDKVECQEEPALSTSVAGLTAVPTGFVAEIDRTRAWRTLRDGVCDPNGEPDGMETTRELVYFDYTPDGFVARGWATPVDFKSDEIRRVAVGTVGVALEAAAEAALAIDAAEVQTKPDNWHDVPPPEQPASPALASVTLPQQTINNWLSRNYDSVRRCYDAARRSNPQLRAHFVVHITVGSGGRVREATVRTPNPSRLEMCVTGEIRRWVLHEHTQGTVSFSYPFFFEPRSR